MFGGVVVPPSRVFVGPHVCVYYWLELWACNQGGWSSKKNRLLEDYFGKAVLRRFWYDKMQGLAQQHDCLLEEQLRGQMVRLQEKVRESKRIDIQWPTHPGG